MSEKKGPRSESATMPIVPAAPAAPTSTLRDDDRPTEVHAVLQPLELVQTREQLIIGSTIRDMMNNPEHNLSDALGKLVAEARRGLPQTEVDARATLLVRHHFEFDRRVGYDLKLKVFDSEGAAIEVFADLDQDGRKIRRGSLVSKLITI